MTIHEPDVSLTDLGLAIECAWFVIWLARHAERAEPLRRWFIAFFAATGFAAFLGTVTHAFVPDPQSATYKILWIGIFSAIGLAAVASWAIGSWLILTAPMARIMVVSALVMFAVYIAIILLVSQSFAVAIIYYLPSAVLLLIAFTIVYLQRRERPFAVGIAGILLTFLAALVQQTEFGLHTLYFDHNAFYHLIQAAALLLIFLAARGLTRPAMP